MVWGTLVLATVVNLVVLPRGYVLPGLYAVPLLGASLVWPPRGVAGLLALVLVPAVLTFLTRGVPAEVGRIGLAGLVVVGALAIHAARLRRIAHAAGQARDELVAAVAHDLKNPLTVLRGRAHLLRRRLERVEPLPPQQRARLVAEVDHIDTAASRTLARLNEVLDVVRLDAGQTLDLTTRPTDLVALAQRVATTYDLDAARHRIIVVAEVPALVGAWDGFRLERVLENLLANAIKYSPAGGQITVGIRRAAAPSALASAHPAAGEDWAVLCVQDQGVGIPPADLKRVFQPYTRGTNVVGVLPGSGIGLAGARRIVAQHGGTITVESIEGRGSTFTVWLPLHLAQAGATVGAG